MDAKELFHACRTGDITKVQYLFEQKEVELNLTDKWDSSPLYYACLCGHEELVNYLLENGARCEANTFEGERCLYGALTDKIRNLLKCYNVISSKQLRRDLYEEFLRRLLEDSAYSDVTFNVHGEMFPVHRCILAARCEYFATMFRTKWLGRRVITIKHSLVVPVAFKSILQYLYTGYMDTHVDNVEDCLRLAKQCRLQGLMEEIDERIKKFQSFEMLKPGVTVTTITIEPTLHNTKLQEDLGRLGDLALPNELCSDIFQALGNIPFAGLEDLPIYPDICFVVEEHKFLCHKVFFCGRSDFFKALLVDHFGESNVSEDNLPLIPINEITTENFRQLMYYLYQDSCELTKETVVDMLKLADQYLLMGLKRLCANNISKYINTDTVLQILVLARLFNLRRLADQCCEFMANNLQEVMELDDFAELVRQDAANLECREDTDTLEIIDDIRYNITNYVQTFSDMMEAEEKLRMIDDFLENMNIDA
ncbi:ankyrin repeat and BTB/POZ domain-containing protein 1-like [Ylistrum balloti]|uniref:ankyrin repeat and BTB/POZ domain-containing protein 1-like n=1 Tax=Ylistrum balloti TaxID=509963 RepID=UPI002905C60B|nr:ankyrin repeat and BTB/POZ domain-containing protein 1-like [Ylistrum balloti]